MAHKVLRLLIFFCSSVVFHNRHATQNYWRLLLRTLITSLVALLYQGLNLHSLSVFVMQLEKNMFCFCMVIICVRCYVCSFLFAKLKPRFTLNFFYQPKIIFARKLCQKIYSAPKNDKPLHCIHILCKNWTKGM